MSLRDVERVLKVMMWFYRHREMLFARMNRLIRRSDENSDDEEEEEEEEEEEGEYYSADDSDDDEMPRAALVKK